MTKAGLGHPFGIEKLRDGIRHHEKINYSQNGNRTMPASRFIRKIMPILPRVGVTRIADVSELAGFPFPVFQSTRPNTNFHYSSGLNSGAQGKGLTKPQAMISCMMESIEAYCSEARNVHLIRASYDWLKEHQLVVDPVQLHSGEPQTIPTHQEPIMWTPAYSVSMDRQCFVPAECVYYPFTPRAYQTLGHFSCGTNGLASGSTYLEAVNHALYELIERAYTALFERGLLKVQALFEQEVEQLDFTKFYKRTSKEYQIQLYSLQMEGIRDNIPVIFCTLVGKSRVAIGNGCAGDVETAITRALSEALQAEAIAVSGSREDMSNHLPVAMGLAGKKTISVESLHPPEPEGAAEPQPENGNILATLLPKKRTLHLHELKKQVRDRKFKDLHQEFVYLRSWLEKIGCREILIANLTRVGIDVPVVKVILPGVPHHLYSVSQLPPQYHIFNMYKCAPK